MKHMPLLGFSGCIAAVLILFSTGLIAPPGSDDALNLDEMDEVMASSEMDEVIRVRQEGLGMIKAAIGRHGEEKMVAAFKAELANTANSESGGAASEAVRMVYGTQVAADAFMLRLSETTEALVNRFPALGGAKGSDSACSATDQKIEAFFASFEGVHAQGVAATEVPCESWAKFAQYTACLAVCTSGGPILYWPCAYLCICAFCPDMLPDEACL